jgi:predicted RNA-binding Zn-ribbon protein involved in translation (DUF1610 family)
MPRGVYIRIKPVWNKGISHTEEYKNRLKKIMGSSAMREKISKIMLSKNRKRRAYCSDCGKEISYRAKKCKIHTMKGKSWTEARKKAQEFVVRKKEINFRKNRKNRKSIIMNKKEYHPDWHKIRKQIYERDRWICQECGCKCLDKRRNIQGRKIQCHHIDYDTKNNNWDNLITLCSSCHCKTNFKRIDWINYFKGKHKPLIMFVSSSLKTGKE